jgi:hypothetical protein
MSTGMRARIVTMRMRIRMRRKNHRMSMMDQRRMCTTHLGPSDVERYENEDGDNADADEDEAGSQADDRSTQNVEH